MNANGRFGGLLKNHGVSLVIGAATAGFAAHINSSVTHINNSASNTDDRVANIERAISAQDTSIARSIAALQDTLEAAMRNWRQSLRLRASNYDTLRATIDTLQGTLSELSRKVDVVDDSFTSKARKLEESVDTLHNTIQTQSARFAKKAHSLKHAVRGIRKQNEKLHTVRIYVGEEKTLRDCEYLKTSGFLCCKKYKIESFPDTGEIGKVKDGDHVNAGKVMAVRVGKSFTVSGKVAALCGFHGKLRKGKDYAANKTASDTTRVTFTGSTIAGQRILVVLK